MIRIIGFLFLNMILGWSLPAQNLIPNGGFEDTVQLSFSTVARYWSVPTSPSPNHYHRSTIGFWGLPNNLAGYQETRTAFNDAYYGILMYDFATPGIKKSREYLQCKLNQVLIQDSIYCFRIYLSLADSAIYASRNQLGVYFSNTKVSASIGTHLPYTPQLVVSPNDYITEKKKWLQYDLPYTATGGERYLIIGNFNDTNGVDTMFVGGGKGIDYHTTYYYIDDLWLSHCDSLPDTSIGIWEQQAKHQLKLYPNPSNGLIKLESEVLVARVKMYDVQGRLLQIIKQPSKQIELPETKGIYLLRLELENGEVLSRKVVRN